MIRPSTVVFALAGAMVTTSAGFLLGTLAEPAPAAPATPTTVHCPVEDECQVDYRDGAWWLRTYDDHSGETPGPWVRVSR